MDADKQRLIYVLEESQKDNFRKQLCYTDKCPGELSEEVNAELQLLFADMHLTGARLAYLKTGNPLYIWRAYKEARRLEKVLPPWFFEYLDEAARKLADAVDLELVGDWNVAVASSFGLDHESKRTTFRKVSGKLDMCRGHDAETIERMKTDKHAYRSEASRHHWFVQKHIDGGSSVREALEAASKELGVPVGTLKRHHYMKQGIVLKK